jgi:DNA-binding LacI/PurR family transcriptional regulator
MVAGTDSTLMVLTITPVTWTFSDIDLDGGALGQQPTMADIARRAGVSRIAVSYALNDQPGVSPATRERIRDIARELGYRANGPALALHGAAARAVGLVMLRSSAAFTVEVFRRELIAGIQTELSARGFGLALQFVADLGEEVAVHRRWSAERRVDGVLLVDPRDDDPRLAVLAQIGLPAVVAGGTPEMNGVWADDAVSTGAVVDYLIAAGHRRIARVSGPDGLAHTTARNDAFRRAAADVTIVAGDYTGADGARLTRLLLAGEPRPTAIVYDNDVMAVAGLGAAQQLGVAVPADLSIVACEDSPLCQAVGPSLTVVKRDIVAFGRQAARLLFEALEGGRPHSVKAAPARLVIRRSSGPAPHPS